MLEPLFRCNLSCSGCGKIAYPEEILERRLSSDECLAAAEECGAPVVSVAGGEPLVHAEMGGIVSRLVARKFLVYLCTNGLLLKARLRDYAPSPYLTFSIHLDGPKEKHDALAGRAGVFDTAVEGIRTLRSQGFRFIINCTLYEGGRAAEIADFFDFIHHLRAEGITLSPGFRYPAASQREGFLERARSKQLFREIFRLRKRRGWKFNQSSLFLDFLAGNRNYPCTPWGNPTRNVLGWQRPCYLIADGYAPTFRALMEETDWDRYGPGRNGLCSQCMLHSGFEATAVNDTLAHPLQAFSVFLKGPRTDGPYAPDPTEDLPAIQGNEGSLDSAERMADPARHPKGGGKVRGGKRIKSATAEEDECSKKESFSFSYFCFR